MQNKAARLVNARRITSVHEPEPAPSRVGQRRRTQARILAAAARLFAERGRPITADDAELRAALAGAVMLSVIVSRHLLRTGALSDASPEHVIDLLRPCLRSLTRGARVPRPADLPRPRPLSPECRPPARLPLGNCPFPGLLELDPVCG